MQHNIVWYIVTLYNIAYDGNVVQTDAVYTAPMWRIRVYKIGGVRAKLDIRMKQKCMHPFLVGAPSLWLG